jgi:hypothetical protein
MFSIFRRKAPDPSQPIVFNLEANSPTMAIDVPSRRSLFSTRVKTLPPIKTKPTDYGDTPLIIATLTDLQRIEDAPPLPKTPIILSGDLVLVSETTVDVPADYVRQPDRIAKSFNAITNRGNFSLTLKVWLHKSVSDTARRLKRNKFVFAIDQYLRYGNSLREPQILIAGCPSQHGTIIHAYTFRRGSLTSIHEAVLPDMDNARFVSDFQQYLESRRKLGEQGEQIVLVSPLPSIDLDGTSHIGDLLYRKPVRFPITDADENPGFFGQYASALALLVVAFVGYAGALMVPYNDYYEASNDFISTRASIPQTETDLGPDRLSILKAQRLYLTEERVQKQHFMMLQKTAQVLASEGLLVKELTLNVKKAKPEDPDLRFIVTVPRQGKNALEQGRKLLDRLADRLGVKLWNPQNGYREVAGDTGTNIQYTIEGKILHD